MRNKLKATRILKNHANENRIKIIKHLITNEVVMQRKILASFKKGRTKLFKARKDLQFLIKEGYLHAQNRNNKVELRLNKKIQLNEE